MIPISFSRLDPARTHALLTWLNSPQAAEFMVQLECLEAEAETQIAALHRAALQQPDNLKDAQAAAENAQFYQRCREMIVEMAAGRFELKQPISQIA